MDFASILSIQNHDGGWPYRKGGSSWTEPTTLALLMQSVSDANAASMERGFAWLRAAQRPDGGWPPAPAVAHSTWVTALPALLPQDGLGISPHAKAVQWLMKQTGRESSFTQKVRDELMGSATDLPQPRDGWPFFPGATAWVQPTAMSILALEKAQRYEVVKAVEERIENGRQFLMDRICSDGGWNYGRSRVLGIEAPSYPETTGQALLALRRVRSPNLDKAVATAKEYARQCQSAEGLSWLQLGLQAHGITASGPARELPCRSLVDSALYILACCALNGKNVFVE